MKIQQMRFAYLLPRTLGSFVLLALITSAGSGQLMVDFSRAPDDEPLQEGWHPFRGDGTDIFTESFDFNGAAIDVTIEGNTHWRDYRAATGQFTTLSDLLRDGPLCNDFCEMMLTLENLANGDYEIRTYLHTTQFGEQDGRPFTPFAISLTDGKVSDELITEDAIMSDDISDDLSTQTIPFSVVGGSPVQIRFDKLGGNDHLAVPGFELGTPGSLSEIVLGDPGGGDPGGGLDISFEGGLLVDFSRAPDEFPLQEDWEPFVGDGTEVFTETYEFEGASVDITIEGNTHWRDYRPATGDFEELSDLLSDGPLCNNTCLMQLTLENLKDGQYELVTVLHTTQFGPQDGRPFTPFEIRLTDGKAADEIVVEDKLMSDDSSDELSTEAIAFEVVGGSPVEIVFDKPGGNDHLAIAGFQLLAASGEPRLMAGDANQDFEFNQLDLVKVQIAAKYLTGQAATWGEGDWDGAPGGTAGNPPQGDGQFSQLDIIGALASGVYLTGPYVALQPNGTLDDEQTSLVYDSSTGELKVDVPAGKELTSINIDSAGSKFIGDKPAVLDGAFDNASADNVFKATFGGSFGSITFGNVLEAGLTKDVVAADLSAVGSLAGGGGLGDVDLVYVPEPTSFLLFGSAALCVIGTVRRRRHRLA